MGLPGQGEPGWRPPAREPAEGRRGGVRRAVRRAGDAFGDFWFTRSLGARRLIAGGAAALVAIVLALLLLGGGSPPDDAEELVPADAFIYAHLHTDEGSAQFQQAVRLGGRLQRLPELLQALTDTLRPSTPSPVSLADDVRPWLGGELAVAVLPEGGGGRVALLESKDDAAARKFAEEAEAGGILASELVDGFLVLGLKDAVDAVAATARGGESLADAPAAQAAREDLPGERVADLYISPAGGRFLRERSPRLASQLDTFLDLPASEGAAGALVARDGGLELKLVSNLNPARQRDRPSFFRSFPPFGPKLDDEPSAGAVAYLGLGSPDASLRSLLATARAAAPALARSFQDFARQLRRDARINLARDVLPLLSGETAVFVEPSAEVPVVTLVVDGVDEKRAGRALAGISGSLVRAARRNRLAEGAQPRIEETRSDGVPLRSIRLSSTVNLAYAIFDGKLVVATDPAGIGQVQRGETHLNRTAVFQRATSPLPDNVSAVLFLNLGQAFRLAEPAGLAEDPVYASFSEDIRKLGGLGVGVNSDADSLRTVAFLTIEEGK